MKKQTLLLAAAFTLTCTTPVLAQVKLQQNNVEEVLKAMTLEEKATLLVGFSHSQPAGGASNGMLGAHADLVPGAAGSTQAIPRLGIPTTILTDGPAGVRIRPTREDDSKTYYATGFPVGTALACTWNTELVTEVGKSIGNEVLEYGCDVLLAPGMNLHRSPLCGRNFEYYSEDPLVTGKIAAAYVKGIQSEGVGTSIKHYAGNSQETNRTGVNEVIGQRALRELYLKGFEIAVKEADPWTVMSSYNKLNGPFAQASYDLLTTILRKEWGFKGIVMTDWIGQRNTAEQIHAGNDLMEPGQAAQTQEIVDKVKSGELAMADVDVCARRILQYIVRTPHFRNYKYSNTPDLKAHAAITRQSATEGMVLLKNNAAALPLQTTAKAAVFGITSYDFIAGGTGSGDVNKAYTIDLMTGLNNAGLKVTDDLGDLYKKYKSYAEATNAANNPNPGGFSWGKAVLPELAVSRTCIDKQAKAADVAIITIGRQAGEGADRHVPNDFNLTDTERELLNNICDAFHMAGKKVIVILNMGNVIETASWKELPDAILMAWQPGQEGGNSVADVLTGKENPSGKLTMTFPVAATDAPAMQNYPNVKNTNAMPSFFRARGPQENVDYTLHKEGINVGYRYFATADKAVSYPFGYGLSYTQFAYSRPTVKAEGDGFVATITVTNTGKTAGKEVAQLYVTAPKGGLDKPARELKAFAKTRKLNPGESQTLSFKVSAYELASFNEATSSWESPAGAYTLLFSKNANESMATAQFNMRKPFTEKVNDVLRPDMELK